MSEAADVITISGGAGVAFRLIQVTNLFLKKLKHFLQS